MELSTLVHRYISARDICPQHRALLAARCLSLEVFAGNRPPLSEEVVNAWLSSLAQLAPSTRNGYRANILAVWRFASDEGLADWPNPRRIKRFRVPAPNVECYTVDEASELIRAAACLAGQTADKIPRRLYWSAIIRMAWDTGLRRSDLWRLKRSSIRPDGVVIAVSHKSGQRTFHTPYDSTLAAVQLLPARNGSLLFPWSHHVRTFTAHFNAIVEESGIMRGTFKWLRRSSGSYVEAEHPGAGPRHLGHSNPATFYRHYDARAVSGASGVRPPEILSA